MKAQCIRNTQFVLQKKIPKDFTSADLSFTGDLNDSSATQRLKIQATKEDNDAGSENSSSVASERVWSIYRFVLSQKLKSWRFT